MKKLLSFIYCCIVFYNLLGLTATFKSHPITTQINAKWTATPFALEISEFLADESQNLFWDYVEGIVNLEKPLETIENDLKNYKAAVSVAEQLLSGTQISLMKLSLSLHTLSPRIQANLQIAHEILKSDCDTDSFINIGDKIVCTLEGVDAEIKKQSNAADQQEVETFGFDHVYSGSENNTVTVVLYGHLGTASFAKLHNAMKKLVEKGDVKYVFRHYLKTISQQKLRLSGYGVELHLKSTEYKSQDDSPKPETDTTTDPPSESLDVEVEGFDFGKLKERFPSLIHSLDRFRNTLLENHEDIAPLKAWEFQELGLQAAERIASIQGEESLQILQIISQNFPTQAKSLLHAVVSEDFKKEMRDNIEVLGRSLNLQPPDAALFVNGLFFDVDTIDINSLVETLRTELRVLDGLYKIGIKGKTASPLLALDLSSSSKDFAIDIRDTSITWINDIETNSAYSRWPSSLMDLLRPTFPGMLRNIRKNIFNLVLVVNPLKKESQALLKLTESFVVHMAPLRLGIVFDLRNEDKSKSDDYRAILCGFNYVSQQQNPQNALGFLTDIYSKTQDRDVTYADVYMQLKQSYSKLTPDVIEDILGEDSDYDYGQQLAMEFLDRLGMPDTPQALLNGVPISAASLNIDDFEEAVLTEVMQQTPTIQKSVYRGELTDSDNLMDYLMQQPHVMPRLNQRILSNDDPATNYLDISGTANKNIENVNILGQLSNRDMTATLMSNLKYFESKKMEEILGNKVHFQTIWVVADLNEKFGRSLLENGLRHMKTTVGTRIAFIPNADGDSGIPKTKNLNQLVWAASHVLSGSEATDTVLKWLSAVSDAKEFEIPTAVKGFLSSTELHMKLLRTYSQRVLGIKSSEKLLIANGRILGPLNAQETFSIDDFNLMERFSSHHYGDKIRNALNAVSNEEVQINSEIILKLISILVPRQQSKSRFTIPTDIKEDHTVVKLPPKFDKLPYFEIVAVLDPATRGAQKLSPLLIMLRQVINCHMKVVLCAVDKHSDMPVKNYYRFVLEHELQFSATGKLEDGPIAKFTGIPVSPLLTQNLQVPENWLVEVVRSVYDLDNIKLQDINGPVHSEFELEHLLLEGHCFDTTTGSPPRGLQITLGTQNEPIKVDTIVMANLGYFQLKANPGAWVLKLRHGKSADIYDITAAEGTNTIHSTNGETRVIINSLRSHVLKLRVTKKPGKSHADLLGDDDSQSGIWDSITSSFTGGGDDKSETINIFSVASGHLYERLLRIMMLSLVKHTKSPVKFWFLKNYLSPQFVDSLPHMAKEYNVQYELVQYKWPRWLHQQTEKQRTIWGYKILFLDVLFPLDVKKIIFVDADAIVRADIKELNTMDLGGAPYAYTPFCDSRREMEGFRFWKQGYWRNHLQGRKYHISALYVVDLKKFRKIAAGDRLRGQYQALSQDPNSLSNLDQDLPNNMIHQVSIKSLPQEWLFCETWCNSDGLQYAKVIDLCNNPQTKEAKLTAAQRIVPEWKDYDNEIKNLMMRVEAGEVEHEDDGGEVVDIPTAKNDVDDEHDHSEL